MKFLLPPFTWEKCQPPLPTWGEIAVWTENLEIFSLHSPPDMRTPIFQRKSKMFLSSAYKRKICPNRTPFCSKRSRSCFPSSHLSTADKNPVWPKKLKNYFSVLSPIHLGRNGPIGRKKSKKISPPTDKSCEKATRVRLIHFNILLAIQERQS